MKAEQASQEEKRFDPIESIREMRDAYLESMAKIMADAVNTEGYAQASGTILDNYLTASSPFKEALDQSMVQALEQLSLPSRQDIIVLAERFTNVEMRLDDVDAKLDTLSRIEAKLDKLSKVDAKLDTLSRVEAKLDGLSRVEAKLKSLAEELDNLIASVSAPEKTTPAPRPAKTAAPTKPAAKKSAVKPAVAAKVRKTAKKGIA